jgi:hypothetical protein
MDIIGGIILIGCGILCIPSLVLKKAPDAKQLFDKIAPYQGVIGFVICVLGIVGTIWWFFTIGYLLARGFSGFVLWISDLAVSALSAVIGFMLGFGQIKISVLQNAPEDTKDKAETIYERLVNIQGKLGIAGIAGGSWVILFSLVSAIFGF